MINANLTDWQRMQLAQLEYYNWQVSDDVLLPDGKMMGTVIQVIDTEDGFRSTVIKSSQYELTLLFRGSSGVRRGDPTTWTNEWLRVNLPVGNAIINQVPTVPSEMWTAVRQLNTLLEQYSQSKVYIYGHSLGSINAQYALANCDHPQQIQRADLYEGPNIYWLLDRHQRKTALQLRTRIFNSVDPLDVIALGYLDRQHTIGLLQVVDSVMTDPINQHMWGGYQFDCRQRLKRIPQGMVSPRALIDQHLLQHSQWKGAKHNDRRISLE